MSGFTERVRGFVRERKSALEDIRSEDQTKLALLFPFIRLLGYDTTNPREVIPEFTADVGVKRGEKVDVAIQQDGKPVILIECKCVGDPLTEHNTQLYRYFSVTAAKFAILTDGCVYQFYTDIDEQNKLDEKPFFVISLFEAADSEISYLQQFEKNHLDVDSLIDEAERLKYTRELKKVFEGELRNPSDEFIRHLAGGIFTGRFTERRLEYFKELTTNALSEYMREYVNRNLQHAMNQIEAQAEKEKEARLSESVHEDGGNGPESLEIAFSEEHEAFFIIKAIARTEIDVSRLTLREGRAYSSIVVDGNIRRGLCRLQFGSRKKYIVVPSDQIKRIEISSIDDIYKYENEIRSLASSLA